MDDIKGVIFGIQHFSIHDGNGVRTNVFLKGCPLNCIWCHNPEGIPGQPSLAYTAGKCVHCGACAAACPGAHTMADGLHTFNRDECEGCFRCVDICPAQALEQVGREMTVDELMDDLLRDMRYYRSSGGGVTLSGGEPMRQFDFTEAVLNACRKSGVNTAMETCGLAPPHMYESVVPLVDTFLFDVKESDPARHREYIGVDNTLIQSNLALIAGRGARVILRCPIVPGLNDRAEHFEYLARLSRAYDSIEGVELMPYHKLGLSKAGRMGLKPQRAFEEPSQDTAAAWNKAVEAAGGRLIVY